MSEELHWRTIHNLKLNEVASDSYWKTSDREDYNCISFVFGDTSQSYDPCDENSYWHKEKVSLNSATFDTYVDIFREGGYEECSAGEDYAEFQVIAIYVHPEDNPPFGHVAFQTETGIWKSKLGDEWEDIEHKDPTVLVPGYGDIVMYMKKPR